MNVQAKNVDAKKCLKASFVLKSKGSNLTQAVKETIEKLAEEYDKMNKQEDN